MYQVVFVVKRKTKCHPLILSLLTSFNRTAVDNYIMAQISKDLYFMKKMLTMGGFLFQFPVVSRKYVSLLNAAATIVSIAQLLLTIKIAINRVGLTTHPAFKILVCLVAITNSFSLVLRILGFVYHKQLWKKVVEMMEHLDGELTRCNRNILRETLPAMWKLMSIVGVFMILIFLSIISLARSFNNIIHLCNKIQWHYNELLLLFLILFIVGFAYYVSDRSHSLTICLDDIRRSNRYFEIRQNLVTIKNVKNFYEKLISIQKLFNEILSNFFTYIILKGFVDILTAVHMLQCNPLRYDNYDLLTAFVNKVGSAVSSCDFFHFIFVYLIPLNL